MRMKTVAIWATLWVVTGFIPAALGQEKDQEQKDQGLVKLNTPEKLGNAFKETAQLRHDVLELFGSFEKLEKVSASQGCAAARAAVLMGMPARAIPLMERAMKEDPNGNAGLNVPFSLSGHFTIALLAKHSGDWERAIAEYEAALETAKKTDSLEKRQSAMQAIAMIYLAEAQEKTGKKQEAMTTLEGVGKLPDQNNYKGGVPTAPFKAWAKWNLGVMRTGKTEQPEKELSLTWDDIPIIALISMDLSGFHNEEMRKPERPEASVFEDICIVISASDSGIDRDSMLILQGLWRMNQGKREYAKGKPLFLEGMNRGGFFGVQNGLLALMCMKELKEDEEAKTLRTKLLEKYPKMDKVIYEIYPRRNAGE